MQIAATRSDQRGLWPSKDRLPLKERWIVAGWRGIVATIATSQVIPNPFYHRALQLMQDRRQIFLLTIVVATYKVSLMSGKLQAETRKLHPFESLEQEAALNLHKTAD